MKRIILKEFLTKSAKKYDRLRHSLQCWNHRTKSERQTYEFVKWPHK